MNRVTITCSNGPVELSEFVEDLYSVSEKANRALKELRIGLPTWTAMNLHNGWQELVNYYNQYAYIPIEKMERIDGLLVSLDESGSFI